MKLGSFLDKSFGCTYAIITCVLFFKRWISIDVVVSFMNDVSSNQECSSERRALMIFSRWWVYVTITVGVGIFLEFSRS